MLAGREVETMPKAESDSQPTTPVMGSLDDSIFPRETPPPDLRTDVAHSARIYDYILGGKTNYQRDRDAAEQLIAAFPITTTSARANRAFMYRAVRFLAQQHGIDQFLDIGTGIPTSPNLHEVAQAVTPSSRVVYVDSDPIVLAHARALLSSSPAGRTAYLDADLRQPAEVLDSPELARTLDLTRPVALFLLAILHFIPDEADPAAVIRQLVDRLPAGSFLVLNHATYPEETPDNQRAVDVYKQQNISLTTRDRDAILALVPPGLEILEPGLQPLNRWRPELDPTTKTDGNIAILGLIARKP
jgi:S-adenosyl methyltransferase